MILAFTSIKDRQGGKEKAAQRTIVWTVDELKGIFPAAKRHYFYAYLDENGTTLSWEEAIAHLRQNQN